MHTFVWEQNVLFFPLNHRGTTYAHGVDTDRLHAKRGRTPPSSLGSRTGIWTRMARKQCFSLMGSGGSVGFGGGAVGRWTTVAHVHALSLPSSLFPSHRATRPLFSSPLAFPLLFLLPCFTARRCAGVGRADTHMV